VITPLLVLEQLLNGLQYGVTLFLMAAGLTLVFGIMNMVNLAHGSLYMVGAYLGTMFSVRTGSFVLGVVLGLLATLVVGVVVEVVTLRTLYERDHLDQVLATFGLILFFNELVAMVWGRSALYASLPAWLSGHVQVLPGVRYPVYRALVIVVGLVVALLLWVVVTRTRLGMLIRAGASNRTMVAALGVNVRLLYTIVFGCGALVGAIIVGMVETLGKAFLKPMLATMLSPSAADSAGPALASMLIYLLMAIVLTVRPQGLFPARIG
jgi:branched-chain amino acid transport system permease protein